VSGYTSRFGPLALAGGGYRFRLYAPAAARVDVLSDGRVLPMDHDGDWFAADDVQALARTRYAFRIDGERIVPDPASRFQPEGVHAPSAIVPAFAWPPVRWSGRAWHEHVIYELHVGTFTFAGTYAAASERLDDLVALGITALELMPVAAFPGTRNWGYDGVLPFAPFAGYGKPSDLKRFIIAAHERGLAVLLDVVYNHFGPEGNYLHAYAPGFFTDRHHTPWGAAIDVTVPDVRAYFIENACYWIDEYRFDGLRLDATHAIVDPESPSFLHDLRVAVEQTVRGERPVALVVENDANDVALLDDGYTAQWNDDVHHCAHVLGTGESGGYYRDYVGDPAGLLGRALSSGYAYQGESSPHHAGAPRGAASRHLRLSAFVIFLQNHDQIGNRAFGERLARLAGGEAVRALSALILLAPSPPLLFMGEEWAASTSFLYFCDFEPDLARAVTAGRRREFASFAAFADPLAQAQIPDPSARTTFEASVLRWDERSEPKHAEMLAWYTRLLALRAREIVPAVALLRGSDGAFRRVGERGLQLRWNLPDGAVLHADAQLAEVAGNGFAERLAGAPLFATHDDAYPEGRAPAWSVRWSRS
jgi:maltooligosyltrehalose trehalohydrolase